MKSIVGILLVATYVAVVYAFLHLSLFVFGPFALTPGAPIEWRSVTYVAISAIAAAVLCVALYIWLLGSLSFTRSVVLGLLAVVLQKLYVLSQQGWPGLAATVSKAPWHSATTALAIAAAIPLVAAIAANYSLKRTAAE